MTCRYFVDKKTVFTAKILLEKYCFDAIIKLDLALKSFWQYLLTFSIQI